MTLDLYRSTQQRLAEIGGTVAEVGSFGSGDRTIEYIWHPQSGSLSIHGNGGEIAAWDDLRDARFDTLALVEKVLADNDVYGMTEADIDTRFGLRIGPRAIARIYAMTEDEILGKWRQDEG